MVHPAASPARRAPSSPDLRPLPRTIGASTGALRPLPVLPRRNVDELASAAANGGGSTGLGAIFRDHPTAVSAVMIGATGVTAFLGMSTTASAATLAPAREVGAAQAQPIVFVGMNATSTHEADAIKKTIGPSKLTFIQSTATPDKVVVKGVSYDLSAEEGRLAFADAIGLDGDRAQALAEVLSGTGAGARDELAQLAQVFAKAEAGNRSIPRLVFSGHSVGSGVWGDGNGSLGWSSVGKLALVFPKAAGQVEDLLIAGCYSGGESTMDTYRAMFPNLKTIWAYDGSAPGSVSGAVPHILRWEKNTRGPKDERLNRNVAAATRKGENVAIWTAGKGFDNGQPLGDLESVRTAYQTSRTAAAPFLSGASVVTDPQDGPLREHYNDIQRLLGRSDLPKEERTQLEGERDHAIRLLYYGNVRAAFQALHRDVLKQGFSDLGLPAPDFAKLSRPEALTAIRAFDQAVKQSLSVSDAVRNAESLLHGGLRDLLPTYIPEAWI